MYYYEWHQLHNDKVLKIKEKLQNNGYTKEDIISYFEYDNMKINEPEFCPLYKENKKCHNIDNLNCYLCACPHFLYSDESPISEPNIFSVCKINSKFQKQFEYENKVHCDCSNCFYPHKRKVVEKYYNNIKRLPDYPLNESLLFKIRNFQLSSILVDILPITKARDSKIPMR